MKNYSHISFLFCLLLAIVVYSGNFAFIADAENMVTDYQFRMRKSRAADERLLIVGIDPSTLSWASRPMFAWGPVYAELARAASQASASLLLLDLVFSPGAEAAIKEHVASIATELSLALPPAFYRKIGFEKVFREALLQMKKSSTQFIAGFVWEGQKKIFSDPALLHIAAAGNTGYFNLHTAGDGTIRKVELFADGDDGKVYSVAALAAMRLGLATSEIPPTAGQQINFCGPRGSVNTVSLRQIIEDYRQGKDLRPLMSGKAILVGFNDVIDFKATPYGYMPGVEIHANIIDNLLQKRFLRETPGFHEFCMVILLLVILLLIARIRQIFAVICGLVFVSAWVAVSVAYFDSWMIPIIRPVILLLLFSVCEGFAAYRSVSRERKRVRQVFSRYVSDTVVKEILAASDQDFLAGRRRRLCILMADIRGFTSFSEKHDAHAVVSFLNTYFARVTEIIMRHRGVVDKFLGDGILAFFNAPVESADYVDQAVAAAMEIIDYTRSREFCDICLGSNLKVGLALHCGQTVFGNIGSDRKAEFTVIGDAVNACSRMEGLNKDYHTSIIVSGEVVTSGKKAVNWKFLDKTSLRGKTEEIELYTIADTGGENV
jgi:adenylate cyclase